MLMINQLIGFGAGGRDAYRYWRVHTTVKNNPTYDEVIIGELELRIAGSDQIPTMTAATTSGVTMSASSEYSAAYAAWKAANNSLAGNSWDSNVIAGPWWLKVDFGAGNAKLIEDYRMSSQNSATLETYMPNTWTLQGSNDDTNWATLDSQAGVTWTQGVYKTYTIA